MSVITVLDISLKVSAYALPPTGGVGFDYQLGTAYKPAANVKIVTRDRTATIVKGLYNICYINGFQS